MKSILATACAALITLGCVSCTNEPADTGASPETSSANVETVSLKVTGMT